MADTCCTDKASALQLLAGRGAQRRVLVVVLAINSLMFMVEFGAGLVAGSAALMADSVDMLGDALIYGLSLYALARSNRWKAGAALAKGGFILVLGLAVLVEIGIRIAYGVPPQSGIMLTFGTLALAANLLCLSMLWRFRARDINMASTFQCSRNDVIANMGVLIAAGLVMLLDSPWPDIAVGSIIAILFLHSAVRVSREAWPQFRQSSGEGALST